MNLYLDDLRGIPWPQNERGEGFWVSGGVEWYVVRSVARCIAMIQEHKVDILSLDHDLGTYGPEREVTGYDVLVWLEEQVANDPSFHVPTLRVHSANSSAAEKMRMAIQAIQRMKEDGSFEDPSE